MGAASPTLSSRGHSRAEWIRPRQQSIGLLDFLVDAEEANDNSGLVLAGRYELLRVIGTGATASVYEALDQKTKRRVAIKLLTPGVREQIEGFFGQEARISARVQSPHLASASDFGEDQGHLYIVLSLLAGRPLAELSRGELLPWRGICTIALHVLNALAALHKAGIIHRDVQPENIFVSVAVGDALHGTLLDPGFAAVLPPRRMTIAPEPVHAVFGTHGFIAPETFAGHLPDPRSDLYSLGAVLYLALSGQMVADFRICSQIVLPSPQVFRPEIPDSVGGVVLRALSDIDARYQTAEDMALAIASALEDPGSTAVRAAHSAVHVVPSPMPAPEDADSPLPSASGSGEPNRRVTGAGVPTSLVTPSGASSSSPMASNVGVPKSLASTRRIATAGSSSVPNGPARTPGDATASSSGAPPDLAAASDVAAASSSNPPKSLVASSAVAVASSLGSSNSDGSGDSLLTSAPGGRAQQSAPRWRTRKAIVGAATVIAGLVCVAVFYSRPKPVEADEREVSAAPAPPAPEPSSALAVAPPSLPSLDDVLEGKRESLRACVRRSGMTIAVDLGRDADADHFTKIEVLGDEGTRAPYLTMSCETRPPRNLESRASP